MKPLFKIFRRFITTEDIEKLILQNKCRFDGNIRRVCLTEIGDGRCTGEMEICVEHTDANKKLHVGMTSTLIDAFTTFGLLSHKDSENIDSSSVDLYVAFVSTACLGDVVCVETDSLQVGKKLAYTTGLISNKSNGAPIAIGSHTKYFVRR